MRAKNWVDTEKFTIEYLNDTCEQWKVGNLTYEVGYALKRLDPVAFKEIEQDLIDSGISDGDWVEGEDGKIYEAPYQDRDEDEDEDEDEA